MGELKNIGPLAVLKLNSFTGANAAMLIYGILMQNPESDISVP